MGHSLLCLLGLFLLSTVIHGNTEELGVKPTLTADRLTIPAGGSVTLTCDVKHSADFEYEWFREPSLNTEKTAVVGESKRELVTSEGGIYNCRGRIKGTNSITVESDPVIIQETGHGVNITVTADSTTIPAGGSVTLTCDVKHSADLKYEWVRETSSAVKSTETVGSDKVIKISKGGKYQCRGWRTDITSLIAQSDPVIIQETVSNRIDVTLQHSWSQIFTGETITLRCEIQGGEGKVWKYEWTAPNTNSPPTSSEYRISRVSLSHSGDYRCRGSSDYLLTGWSDAFRLTVSFPSKPTVTLQPSWTQIYSGETVTVRCEGSQSLFVWREDELIRPRTPEYRISRATESDSGGYSCCTMSLSVCSDIITLTVSSDKPRATLTAGTTIIPVGGSVTLTCSVQSSDGWKYEWFRRTQRTSEGQIRDQQNRDIRVSQGGIYSCRGTRGNPVYYTDISDDVTIEITFSNKVVVKQQPNWPQIFRGETITLTCEVQEGGETTEWEYEWRGPRTPTQWTHNNDVTFRVSESSSGDYMCKSRRRDDSYSSTEWSEAFTLSGSNKPKAKLRADNTTVPVGGSVTLTCSVNPSSSSGWKYYWYRDEKSSEALTTQDAVFHSNGQISVSQEGLYRCRGGRGNPVYYTEDSQSVRIGKTVTVSGADSSSSPVWLIVGLVCGVSLIIILLLLLYRCRQSKCADKPPDVIYSNIELENFVNKWKHHKPEQSAVYTNVKTGAAEDSLMYAEVKQPKKQKAKKNKGKSSPAADAAVYSEVTSGSSLSQ
ncbi:Fc receptor-like protein 5 isoform X1 [Oreochromis niloticus]|uniref:Fc receptor-like protein 5 isoform X1 n=1 Tax=Oreochromis niloticus TaxID=8128 RepID=UPI000DF1E46B|nr:Fc receptor-like protein 5 isoform X1 [Oreochromis niloticus]